MTSISKAAVGLKDLESARKSAVFFSKDLQNGFAYCKIVIDKNGNPIDYIYLYVNDAYVKITGSQREVVLGKRATELFPTLVKDPVDWISKYGKVAITGKPVRFEALIQFRNVWYSLFVYSPKKGYFAVIFEDVTDRKKAEEAMAFQGNLLYRAREAIFGVDAKYNIVYWNKGAEDLLGYNKDEVIGKNFQDLLPIKIENSSRAEELSKVEQIGHWEGEAQYRRKDGLYVSVELNAATLRSPNGELLGFVTAARDITQHKQQDREIANMAKFPSENPNPVFRIKGNGTILYSNAAGASFLVAWNSKVGESAPEHISQIVADALASNKKIEIEESFESKTFLLSFAPVIMEGYVNIYANDITERKKSETEREILIEFLKITNTCIGTRELVKASCGFFQEAVWL